MMEIAWIIPLFPLFSFLVLLIFGRKWRRGQIDFAVILSLVSFICALLVLFARFTQENVKVEFTWLTIGETQLTAGFEVNQLNALMLVIVSLVSFLVHMYSKAYMEGDERITVFFAYLGLFTFAMLGLVLSPNLLQTYIFWELVGVGSFLLIGFYFYKEEAKAAAKKAFIMTRIGDVGLLIGMILLFWQVGSFEYDEIFAVISAGDLSETMATLTAILIFIGAVGKSGQFPLHSWLPDAMEGPTPVSALIHAATMVAAGVYLVAALYPLFAFSEVAMLTIAIVGGFTAIFAATIGMTQRDIKRALAYSTVSQLGYMMLALGVGGYVAGVFHLTTHAFFKALLFLAAGSVIHAVHTQDIEKMGGLWKKMKWTAPLFLIGTMAISGVPLLSGFFSKEEILVSAWVSGHYLLFTLAIIAAFFTAFYMFRLFFLVFGGEEKKEQSAVKESSNWMTVPMLVLALLAIVAGYIQTPWFGTFLGDWLTTGIAANVHGHLDGPLWVMVVATVVTFLGILLAWLMYSKKVLSRDWFTSRAPYTYQLVINKYYIDEVYQYIFVKGSRFVSQILHFVEVYLIEGLISLVTITMRRLSIIGSKFQNGQTQLYGTVAFVGLAILIVVFALTGGGF
ncbi:NADH-quinone oxidoreductase subunit L [Cytobacillus sp. Sa5YUA1]|uniref:NADH-quinone oxidoreductase subunit L n=1 Tax=Cytobacillus stercorigallinarum TaxID=2762240 RepID=A0ABR8QT44_9BACI|nr:NADH-quinone oxidoreductase subunit L [Cytobacillus stercorigallinarum]MBD7938705.1 NADH-quinone oxidoreductase subunit L [Cytobacillus stercorigallinarum]